MSYVQPITTARVRSCCCPRPAWPSSALSPAPGQRDLSFLLWSSSGDFKPELGPLASLLEKAMAPHSSILAWKIPWAEEPGGLQSTWSLRVRHDWATSLSLFTFIHWRKKWQPTPVLLPGESQGWGAWWVAVCGVAQSRTRLKRRSSSSSNSQSPAHLYYYLVLSPHLPFLLGVSCSRSPQGSTTQTSQQ